MAAPAARGRAAALARAAWRTAVRHRVGLALAAVVLLGLAPRWEQARFGLPYLHHWDEPFIANRALRMLQAADPNPHFFNYGSLVLYLDAAVDVLRTATLARRPPDAAEALRSVAEVRYRGAVEDRLTNAPQQPTYFISHPSFYLWNRRLTGAFGLAAVVLAFALARRLAEPAAGAVAGAVAGLGAAFALATNPFHVEQSALVTTDVPAATLSLAALWLTLRFVQDQRPRDLCWALVAGGLAVSTKYNAAPVLLVPAAALAVAALRQWPGYRRWLWPALALLPAVAFLAATPFALLDLPTFGRDTGRMLDVYVGRQGPGEVAPGVEHLLLSVRLLWKYLGPAVALGASIGLAVAARRPASLVVFPLGLLVLLATAATRVEFHRNLVLIYPLAAVAFGVAVAALLSGGRWRRPRQAIAALLLLGAGWDAVHAVRTARRIGLSPETRSLVVERLNAGGRWRRVGIARELRLHPLDLARLRGRFAVKPMARLLCAPAGEDVLVLPTAFGAVLQRGQRQAARNEALLALAGPVAFDLAPAHVLWLDYLPPANPGIAVRLPAPLPAALPGACLGALSPAAFELSGGGRRRSGVVAILPAGGMLVTPALALPAGRRLFGFRVEPVRAAAAAPVLAMQLVDAAGTPLAGEHHPVAAPHAWTFPLDVTAPRVVRLRLQAEGPPGTAIRVTSLELDDPDLR